LNDFEKAIALNERRGVKDGDPYNGRGFARVQLGSQMADYAKGVADAQTALAMGPKSTQTLYKAARVYAQAAARADAMAGRRTQAEVRQIEDYLETAIDLLKAALAACPKGEAGKFWREILQKDWALRFLAFHPKTAKSYAQLAPR
jgi:hypothetical protein